MTEDEHLQIRRRQIELSLPYIERKPSEVTDISWLFAKRKQGDYPVATSNNGKWLVFVPVSQVDEVWATIKIATEEGRLGSSAKVATAVPSPNAEDPDKRVICVYTYDWTDEADARRIRQELRELGVTKKIAYKADNDTRSGRYRTNGHTRISKYYE